MDGKIKRLEVEARQCILEGFNDITDGINAHAILELVEANHRLKMELAEALDHNEWLQDRLKEKGHGSRSD